MGELLEVLKQALDLEKEGQAFYEDAADCAKNTLAQKTFKGLAEEEIPLEGRIVAISDVYDALTSERPYKPAFSEEKALAIIREGVGQHFDPEVYAAFDLSIERILAIRNEFSDEQDAVRPDVRLLGKACAVVN